MCEKLQYDILVARGVKPLVQLMEGTGDFHQYAAADKVVGKATGFLYVLLGVKSVFAKVISQPALNILKANNIYVQFETVVEHIINRKKDGICPFEETVLDLTDPQEAYVAILDKMKK